MALPPLPLWDWSGATNVTVAEDDWTQVVSRGTVDWAEAESVCQTAAPPVSSTSVFFALPELLTPSDVESVLTISRTTEFDSRPDSVDQLPTHEYHILIDGLADGTDQGQPETKEVHRTRVRLSKVLKPSIARLTRLVNDLFGAICARRCTPCTALVRRYRPGERRSHPEHTDAEAAVTAVVGLTSAGVDFDGGLFLSNIARRVFLPLRGGDAVVHSSDLFHGVHVRGTGERWSLIVWFRTCARCTMAGADGWFRARAEAGEPIAQYLLGRRLGQEHQSGVAAGQLGGRSVSETDRRRRESVAWLNASATHGFAPSMHMLGRAGVDRGEIRVAVAWLRRAVRCLEYARCESACECLLRTAIARSMRAPPARSRTPHSSRPTNGQVACLDSPTDFGRPTVAMRAAHDLARILLKCAEFGWPPPYDAVDDAVLRTTDVAAEGLQLMRRAAIVGHRHAARGLGEAYQSGRWGVTPQRHLAEGWRACADEADMEGHACEAMASSPSYVAVAEHETRRPDESEAHDEL